MNHGRVTLSLFQVQLIVLLVLILNTIVPLFLNYVHHRQLKSLAIEAMMDDVFARVRTSPIWAAQFHDTRISQLLLEETMSELSERPKKMITRVEIIGSDSQGVYASWRGNETISAKCIKSESRKYSPHKAVESFLVAIDRNLCIHTPLVDRLKQLSAFEAIAVLLFTNITSGFLFFIFVQQIRRSAQALPTRSAEDNSMAHEFAFKTGRIRELIELVQASISTKTANWLWLQTRYDKVLHDIKKERENTRFSNDQKSLEHCIENIESLSFAFRNELYGHLHPDAPTQGTQVKMVQKYDLKLLIDERFRNSNSRVFYTDNLPNDLFLSADMRLIENIIRNMSSNITAHSKIGTEVHVVFNESYVSIQSSSILGFWQWISLRISFAFNKVDCSNSNTHIVRKTFGRQSLGLWIIKDCTAQLNCSKVLTPEMFQFYIHKRRLVVFSKFPISNCGNSQNGNSDKQLYPNDLFLFKDEILFNKAKSSAVDIVTLQEIILIAERFTITRIVTDFENICELVCLEDSVDVRIIASEKWLDAYLEFEPRFKNDEQVANC
jgi:hypothetical protein